MNEVTLLYLTCHPKDISRIKLQTMLNITCRSRFYDSFKMDKCKIAHYSPENCRKIAIPSLSNPYAGLENSTTFYADKTGVSIIK